MNSSYLRGQPFMNCRSVSPSSSRLSHLKLECNESSPPTEQTKPIQTVCALDLACCLSTYQRKEVEKDELAVFR